MPQNGTYVCVTCRQAFKQTATCPKCQTEMTYMGTRWSPPKKTNSKAWRRILKGEWWWDRRRIRRVRARAPFGASLVTVPNHKKGQRETWTRAYPDSQRQMGG